MNIEEQLADLHGAAPPSLAAGALLGAGLADGYAEFDSPVGSVVVTFNINGVSSVDLRSRTPFQREVLQITAAIPSGEVRPYSWLAKEVGKPGAVRAVGSTMARNPVPLIIPCHRVVRTDGHIGDYSLGGVHNKRALLESEGTHPAELERLAARRIRLWGSDTTHIYCNPTCRHARRITGAHLVEFHDQNEAQAAGYRPCEVCRP